MNTQRGEARPVADAPSHASRISAELVSSLTVVADMGADLSPDGSTVEFERRFELRDVHLALGAAVDSSLRDDFIVGVDDRGAVMLMEAALSGHRLP